MYKGMPAVVIGGYLGDRFGLIEFKVIGDQYIAGTKRPARSRPAEAVRVDPVVAVYEEDGFPSCFLQTDVGADPHSPHGVRPQIDRTELDSLSKAVRIGKRRDEFNRSIVGSIVDNDYLVPRLGNFGNTTQALLYIRGDIVCRDDETYGHGISPEVKNSTIRFASTGCQEA